MILDKIAASTLKRVAKAKTELPFAEIKKQALSLPAKKDFPFENALRGSDISFICEVKKASPSKGLIATDFPYLEIAKDYEKAGAAAISVLTEPAFFQGSTAILREIRKVVAVPILRKDFIVEEYQIYESKLMGADAVLLICALLDTATITRYLKICEELGLSALVEVHDEAEVVSAIKAGARIIGVNNRNLKTFQVDLNTSIQLRALVPAEILFVAESGISKACDVARLKQAGADAVLIGEALMKSSNQAAMLAELRADN